jgi:hypothetical protein
MKKIVFQSDRSTVGSDLDQICSLPGKSSSFAGCTRCFLSSLACVTKLQCNCCVQINEKFFLTPIKFQLNQLSVDILCESQIYFYYQLVDAGSVNGFSYKFYKRNYILSCHVRRRENLRNDNFLNSEYILAQTK